MRVVFCDISKAFDRILHEGLLKKLKAAGITWHLLTLTCLIEDKELSFLVLSLHGTSSGLELHKVLFWDHFCFCLLLMIL